MFKFNESFEDEIVENMEKFEEQLHSIPKYAQDISLQGPSIPDLFPDSEAVKILAQNEWQLPLEELSEKLGWGNKLDINELENQLGTFFTVSGDVPNLWVVLSDYGKSILAGGKSENKRFDEEKPGIAERELFEDEGFADDWEDEK